MKTVLRLKAASHEIRCWECRVTWVSWVQRLFGMKRGHTPKLSKRDRALVARAEKAEAQVRYLSRYRELLIEEAMHYLKFGRLEEIAIQAANDIGQVED